MRRRVSVDLDQADTVIGLSVEWTSVLTGECMGIWCFPYPDEALDPAAAFQYAVAQRRRNEQLPIEWPVPPWR